MKLSVEERWEKTVNNVATGILLGNQNATALYQMLPLEGKVAVDNVVMLQQEEMKRIAYKNKLTLRKVFGGLLVVIGSIGCIASFVLTM